jgi:hypothetical protein
MILMFVLLHLFTQIVWFSSKAEEWRLAAGEIVPISTEAPHPSRADLSKKRGGNGASRKPGARRAPRLASVRGRR